MNSEHSIVNENSIDEGLNYRPKDSSEKVYINKLLSRHKKQKTKERIETLVFVCLACVLVVISGIIVSL
jgi:hypothetical protein